MQSPLVRRLKALVVVTAAFLLLSAGSAAAMHGGVGQGLPSDNPAWTWQQPLPQGYYLTAVTAGSPDGAWIAADETSQVLHVTSGEAWSAPLVADESGTMDICFVDALHGWASGYAHAVIDTAVGVVYRTEDGGVTWDEVDLEPLTLGGEVATVEFIDALHGWAGGDHERVWVTSDGGKSWTQTFASGGAATTCLSFADGTNGWSLTSAGDIRNSTDGGQTWLECVPPGGTIEHVELVTAPIGWAVGDGGAVWRSDDAGQTWARQTSGVTTQLNSVMFTDVAHGWCAGAGGVILRTTDGGSTWTSAATATTVDLNDVAFKDASNGWAVGAAGVTLRSEDGGVTWTRVGSGVSATLYVAAFSATQACAVGSDGGIFTTDDGGANWVDRLTPVGTSDLMTVDFGDAAHACAVGSSGILQTVDGGTSWRSVSTIPLTAVDFADARNAWAVGAGSSIYKSADAGATWRKQKAPAGIDLRGVSFPDRLHGWAIGGEGSHGAVLATTNGGKTWRQRTLIYPGGKAMPSMDAVDFLNAKTGWIITSDMPRGTLCAATTNGGKTWKWSSFTQGFLLSDVQFIDRLHGFAVGEEGVLYTTIDGGHSWTFDTRVVGDNLSSIAMVDHLHGWAAGYMGAIMYTESGGLDPGQR